MGVLSKEAEVDVLERRDPAASSRVARFTWRCLLYSCSHVRWDLPQATACLCPFAHRMEQEAPTPPSPRRPKPAAALSIVQMARLHCRERLLVRPIYWTDRHLGLLGCSFGDAAPAPPLIEPGVDSKRGAHCIRHAMEYRKWRIQYREDVVPELLTKHGGPFEYLSATPCLAVVATADRVSRANLHFYFKRRRVQTLECVVFLFKKEQQTDVRPPAIAAYLDLDRIFTLRRDLFDVPMDHQRCKSARSLSRLRLKKITLNTQLHDPYVVAVLIALAQENKVRAGFQREPVLASFMVNVELRVNNIC